MIVFAVVKLPIAKLSNVIGRGYTLAIAISLYTMSYAIMASSSGIAAYAAGSIIYRIGQSGTNVMTTVVISDITSPRWRGYVPTFLPYHRIPAYRTSRNYLTPTTNSLAIGLSYSPYLLAPWVSGLIVDSVLSKIGWRWGIGMFAILMPVGALTLAGSLIYYQHKVQASNLVARKQTTLRKFCSDIDLGGMVLFVAGLGLFLLPISLAGSLPDGWRTPWIPALMVAGCLVLLILPIYEHSVAANPMLPACYFKNRTIVLPILMIAIDSLCYSCTHTYLYTWATISHNMSARNATFFLSVPTPHPIPSNPPTNPPHPASQTAHPNASPASSPAQQCSSQRATNTSSSSAR